MSSEKFDAIIVGGGPSGLSAAYFLAKEGFDVLVIERGAELGSKNVFGGRIYSYILDKYFDGWRNEAPIERWVRSERISFLCKENAVTLEYKRFGESKGYDSFTAFLTKFVSWLGEKVEEVGGTVITGVKVDELLMDDDVVTGVYAGGEKLLSDYTIIAEGINTLLSEKYGLRRKPSLDSVAIGIKEVAKLDENTLNERFTLSSSEYGVSQFLLGGPLNNVLAGGFLYTMKKYVSIGIIVRLENIKIGEIYMKDAIEDFRLHPYISNLLRDATLVEYSAHLVREGGVENIMDKPYGNGYVVVGDAAGFLLNTGFTIRGVDYAMESGRLAANAVIKAHEQGKKDSETLSMYKKYLDKSSIIKSMKKFRKAASYLSNEKLYKVYPELLCKTFNGIYTVEEEPKKLYEAMKEAMKNRVSLFSILRDLWNAKGAL